MSSYASLQLMLDERVEAARERIIYVITAHMDSLGYMPCGRESAERTVSFADCEGGWAIFDDCADRLDINALDGLGRCLTGKMHTHAIGVMGAGNGRMLRLFYNGRLLDTYITSPKAFGRGSGGFGCRGHAIRWRGVLREGATIKELSAAFQCGQQEPSGGFEKIRGLLTLGDSAGYGFASIEDANLSGVITLYFCAANRVRQRLVDRLLKPSRSVGTTVGAFIRRLRCGQWRS